MVELAQSYSGYSAMAVVRLDYFAAYFRKKIPVLAQKVREKMDLQLHGSGYVETARSLGFVANVYLSVVR